ncbi:AAA family ATPase [Tessaracoccus coleopterorum]|uniref:hypothetical protein n=1 Tax=Tessaracoccus coleopterorum TaxID=2714950 RepID=UPI001E4ECD3B|nr:hypothetical protein [Tessaracoccus coleopterorum]
MWAGPVMRSGTLLARRKQARVEVRDDGPWEQLPFTLPTHRSMLADVAEARALRDDLAAWRFYDAMRTDADAPARQPRVGTRTFAMASDGSDVAAALQTIVERGKDHVDEHLEDAFPGSRLAILQQGASSTSRCTSTGCSGRSAAPSSPTGPCAT